MTRDPCSGDLTPRDLAQRVVDGFAVSSAAHVDIARALLATTEAARDLIFALYIYPNYRVDNRGPTGCIFDALQKVAPDIAAELSNGKEPRQIFQERWAEP